MLLYQKHGRRQGPRRTGNCMVIADRLLYHEEPLKDDACRQLVLPESRRAEVLGMDHYSVLSENLGKSNRQKNPEVVLLAGMSGEVKRYCQACHQCQVRAPAKTPYKMPVTSSTRPATPIQVVNTNCVGPIEPSSARCHRYARCIINLCTRWVDLVCLKWLAAKATCDALYIS